MVIFRPSPILHMAALYQSVDLTSLISSEVRTPPPTLLTLTVLWVNDVGAENIDEGVQLLHREHENEMKKRRRYVGSLIGARYRTPQG